MMGQVNTPPQPRQVEITSDGASTRIVVEGLDVSARLQGFFFDADGMHPTPRLTLVAMAGEGLHYEGPTLVSLSSAPDADFREQMIRWLEDAFKDSDFVAGMMMGTLTEDPLDSMSRALIERASNG
jgi:hypothetical protein